MKGTRRNHRQSIRAWLSLLLVIAMMTPMFSAIALAEDGAEAVGETVTEAVDHSDTVEEMENEAPKTEERLELSSDPETEDTEPDTNESDTDQDQDQIQEQPGSGDNTDDSGDPDVPSDEDDDETDDQPDDPADDDEDVSHDPKADAPEAPVIVDIVLPDDIAVQERMSKPNKASDFADDLPDTLDATLSDGGSADVAVRWHCDDYSADYGLFTFVAALDEDVDYALADGVKLPSVQLYVVYISKLEKVSGRFVVAEKPAKNDGDVAEALNWPMQLKATFQGADAVEQVLDIVWNCEKYNKKETGAFKFTAAFADGGDYILGKGVKLPANRLYVVNDENFEFKLTDDDTITITGWKASRGDLVVPEDICGFPVTEIADKAFSGHKHMTSATLSDGIEKLGSRIFKDCDELMFVELPDTLTSVKKDTFGGAGSELALILHVRHDTKLTGEKTLKVDGKKIKLPWAIDSIIVEEKGELTIDTDFTLERDSLAGLTVARGGEVKLTRGHKLVNLSTIIIEGDFTNKGEVYGCSSESALFGEIDGYIEAHTGKDVCTVCGESIDAPKDEDDDNPEDGDSDDNEKPTSVDNEGIENIVDETDQDLDETVDAQDAEMTALAEPEGVEQSVDVIYLTAQYKGSDAKLNKDYDGSNRADLSLDDFELDTTGILEADAGKVSIGSVVTSYNTAAVGNNKINVRVNLSAEGATGNYEVTDFTLDGTIAQRDISDKIVVCHIASQDYTGEAIKPQTLYIAIETTEYELNGNDFTITGYDNNTEIGEEAKVTVSGMGNFTGEATFNFSIVDPNAPRTVGFRFIGTDAPTKVYDGNQSCALTKDNFEILPYTLAEDDLDEVTIETVTAEYDAADAGEDKPVTCAFTIVQTEANHTYMAAPLTIEGAAITQCDISGFIINPIGDQEYTGKPITLTKFELHNGDVEMTEGTDYALTYKDNTDVGDAKLTITGIGTNYTGKIETGFKITPCDISFASVDAIEDQQFTGRQIKPKLTVRDGENTLELDKDYTLSYGENIDIGSKEGTVTINGKGNYKDSKEVSFNIVKRTLTMKCLVNPVTKVYDRNTETSLKASDFSIVSGDLDGYPVEIDAVNATYDDPDVGDDRKVSVTFAISETTHYRADVLTIEDCVITPKPLDDEDITIAAIADQQYTGEALEPALTVKWGYYDMKPDVDYKVTYANNTDVSTAANPATATIADAGKGNFTGTKTVTFKIVNDAPLEVKYNGAAVTKVYDGTTTVTLTPSDFSITNLPTPDAGKVTISKAEGTFSQAGVGTALTLTVKFTLSHESGATHTYTAKDLTITGASITAKPISDTDITVGSIANQTYTGSAIKPKPAVKFGSMTLVEDTDYTLSWSNNVDVSDTNPTVTITGMGNFKDYRTTTFKIVPATRELTITLLSGHEPVRTYDGTANCGSYDSNKVYTPLLKSSDFSINGVADGDTVKVSDDYLKTLKFDSKEAGARTVKISLAGHVTTAKGYSYTISDSSVKSIKGTINPKVLTVTPTAGQSKVYGAADPSSYKASVSGLLTGDSITGKLGRVAGENAGTYNYTSNTLTAGNNYEIKIVEGNTFEITAKAINSTDITVAAIGNQKYTGSAITPTVDIKYGTRTLVKGTDYTVAYSNNTSAGTATITITGTGNYSGSRTASFRIIKTSSGGSSSGSSSSGSSSSGSSVTPTPTPAVTPAPGEPKSINDAACVIEPIPAQIYTGQALEPEVFVSYNDLMLILNVDYTIAYTDNTELGKGRVTVTGINNYTGSRTIAFDIITEEQAEEEPEATPEPPEEEEKLPEDLGELVLHFDFEDEEREDVAVGFILFGTDNRPRSFKYRIDELPLPEETEPGLPVNPPADEAAEANDGDEEVIDIEADEVPMAADDPAAETEQPRKRLRLTIMPNPLTDPEGTVQTLADDVKRDAYELEQLRLTPTQLGMLRQSDFVELVYRLENAEFIVPLDELTDEIDITPFLPVDETTAEEIRAEETAEDETDEDWSEDDAADGVESAPDEEEGVSLEAIEESEGIEITPNLEQVDTYVLVIDQVKSKALTEREAAALNGQIALVPIYRVSLSAVKGTLKAIIDDSEDAQPEPAPELADNVDGVDPDAPVFYPMLSLLKNVEFRVNSELTVPKSLRSANTAALLSGAAENDAPDDAATLPEGAVLLFVDDDAEILDDDAASTHPVKTVDASLPAEEASEDAEEVEAIEADAKATGLDAETDMDAKAETDGEAESNEEDDGDVEFDEEVEFDEKTDEEVEFDEEAESDEEVEFDEKTESDGEAESDDETEAEVEPITAEYVINDEFNVSTDKENAPYTAYARIYPTKSGLYALVVEAPEGWEPEPAEEGEPATQAAAETAPTPTPEPTPEPQAEVIEDPNDMYGYSRKSNAGDQYWLINTKAKTVEYYRADTDTYQIGDYIGSLMSGMLVTFRTPLQTTTIKLKFQQTYKFALMAEESGELLMEQTDISAVESVMSGHRK